MTACAICGRLMRGFGLHIPGALGVNAAFCSMRCQDALYTLVKAGRKSQVGLRAGPMRAAIDYVGPWIGAQASTDLSTFTMAQVSELVRLLIEGYCNAAVEEAERDAGIASLPHEPYVVWHNEYKAMQAALNAGGAYLGSLPSSDLAQFTQAQCDGFATAIIKAFIDENDGDIPF